ncbi:MAG: M3 family metallopeptidase [Alistipes sp.]|nr:M3 family metallopeptidase [Candidatus Alistipes equi]
MKKLILLMSIATIALACQDKTRPQAKLPNIDTTNPLLAEWNTPFQTPPFATISTKDYRKAFDTAMAVYRAEADAIINNPVQPTFYNTIVAMEESGELLDRVSSLFFNLLEADRSDEMQALAMEVQPKLVKLQNDISLNKTLFERVKHVYEHPGWGLSKEDKKLLEKQYKAFVRSGANLSDEDKELYKKYSEELAQLTLKFGENSLAATNAYALNITKEKDVADLPETIREGLAMDAKARGEKGWTVTLKAPSCRPFMKYSTQRELKKQVYMAMSTKAIGGEYDNRENIRRITELRLKIANLLGYKNYAQYILEERMAGDVKTVNDFIEELRTATYDYAKAEREEIENYARTTGLEGNFEKWDISYYTNKFKEEKYALDDELVKPYLKLENVIDGVFMLANKLYGITFREANEIQVYHPDVKAYEVKDSNGSHLAVLYLDFFPRDSKRSGAWMTEFRGGKNDVRPLVSLVMNFTKPTESKPSLLTFDELETFMHEFGHSLHGMFATGKYGSLNGTNVYRDFVELPSQIMENWATEKEYLKLWAKHYQSEEPIPDEIIEKIIAAKNFQAATGTIGQLSYGKIDMAWHTLETPYEGDIIEFEQNATKDTQLSEPIPGTGMCASFTHIFSGGYAAGYYGYKWAEVLAADGYSLFKEKGIFDKKTAQKFRKLLESGGKEHPMVIYERFRGHKPQTQALIDQMDLKKK